MMKGRCVMSDAPNTAATAPESRPRLGFWLLVGVLAISGIAMAVIVFLGLTESKAFGLAGFVFLADVYLIISLAARHTWLQRTIWVGTVLTFVLGVIVTFWPDDDYYAEDYDPNISFDEMHRSTYGVLSDVSYAAHTLLGTLLALGIISMAWRWIKHERVLRVIYYFMFIVGAGAGLFWAIGFVIRHTENLVPLQLGLTILALTAGAIVIIAGFVQRNAERSRELADRQGLPLEAGSARSDEELRQLVRQYVEEYLEERGR